METQEHYKNHLSHFYSWMFGDFDEMVKRQTNLFRSLKVQPCESKVAIDLGAGSGFQSLALLELGFIVHAVDFSKELLDELKSKNSKVETHLGDMKDLSFAKEMNPDLITCMGDTLTHLASKEEVLSLLSSIYELLAQSGKLILTFRDLSGSPSDLERFIPVKSDENRILTCFLEDEIDTVKVFDLLYEKSEEGWSLNKSFYRKIKLSSSWLKKEMEEIGYKVELSKLPNGMDCLMAIKL